MSDLPSVVLTDDEELEECQSAIRRFMESDEEGEWLVKREYADFFQRGIIAHCLMGRAERFIQLAGGSSVHVTFHIPYYSPEIKLDPVLVQKACVSVSKACAIYPLPIYFYDFGCILYQAGKSDEAKIAFANFLSNIENGELDPTMQKWHSQRDIQSSVRVAKELVQ